MLVDETRTLQPSNSVAETILGLDREEFGKLAASILVVVPHRGSEGIHAGLAMNMGIWTTCGLRMQPVEDQFGGFIELTRAAMARNFLDYCVENPSVDKLVMIDSDENMNWDAPFRLAMWDLPIVSGVVCSYHPSRGVFACFTVKDKYGVPRFPSVRFTGKLPSKGLLKAHSTGTGLLCVQKRVFETLFASGEYPFEVPQEERRAAILTGLLKRGEDMTFSAQCEKHGFDRHVDCSVRAVHFKTTGICWPQINLDDEADASEFKVDVRDYLHA